MPTTERLRALREGIASSERRTRDPSALLPLDHSEKLQRDPAYRNVYLQLLGFASVLGQAAACVDNPDLRESIQAAFDDLSETFPQLNIRKVGAAYFMDP